MGSRSSSIPDSVTPYCRELFDRLQTDIEDVSERRDAIIWIAELFLMEQTQACKLLEAREKRIVSTIATATEKAIIQDNQEIIDLTLSSEDEEERVTVPTTSPKEHSLSPRPPPQVTATAHSVEIDDARAPRGQSLVPTLPASSTSTPQTITNNGLTNHNVTATAPQESTHLHLLNGVPLQTVPPGSTRASFQPRVGDWKCVHCMRWQRPYHLYCRSHQPKDENEPCDGNREISGDFLEVQADDGIAKLNRWGNHKGSWFCGNCDVWNYANRGKCQACTNKISQAEYVMGNEDGLKDPPPPPPSPGRSDEQKKSAFFISNGRFMAHSKPKFRDEKRKR